MCYQRAVKDKDGTFKCGTQSAVPVESNDESATYSFAPTISLQCQSCVGLNELLHDKSFSSKAPYLGHADHLMTSRLCILTYDPFFGCISEFLLLPQPSNLLIAAYEVMEETEEKKIVSISCVSFLRVENVHVTRCKTLMCRGQDHDVTKKSCLSMIFIWSDARLHSTMKMGMK